MTIGEHISGAVQRYDFTLGQYVTVAALSDSNVIAASTRRQCCADGAFEIGGAFAGTLSLTCRLHGLTRYAVKGARIILRRWFDGESLTGDSAPTEGIFWVTDAQKYGEIFTLSGQDAMGWADTSSYNHTGSEDGLSAGVYGFGELLTQLHSGGATLEAWMLYTVQLASILAYRQTGITGLLTWRDYDESANGGVSYCNKFLWTDHDAEDRSQPAYFWMYTADGVYKDDAPRSFLRWAAQAAGGFVTVTKDGALTLRQFVQPSLGDALVQFADMELEGCEVADYRLQLYNTAVVFDDVPDVPCAGGGVPVSGSEAPYRIFVEGNPIMNGFRGYQTERAGQYRLSTVWGLAMSMYHYGADRNVTARPFRVKVHTTDRYELGQRIRFPDWRDIGDAESQDLYSIITAVNWTFRGGTELSCGGEDSRVMADCVRATKADKAVREMRSRFKA